jgi:glycosyltransferase involved in cell wall biosynthesis
MGEAGRERVVEHYSVNTIVRRILDLYEDVLQNGRRRSR